MRGTYYLVEIRNPDRSVTTLGRVLSKNDALARRAACNRVRKHLDLLNSYGDVVLREQATGRAVYGDGQEPTVEQL